MGDRADRDEEYARLVKECESLRSAISLLHRVANLVRSERNCVYGIAALVTHEELDRLYAHAENVLGGAYRPEAVIVETSDGKMKPALCYIAPDMKPGAARPDYVKRIVDPAREYGFPDWYIVRLESFSR